MSQTHVGMSKFIDLRVAQWTSDTNRILGTNAEDKMYFLWDLLDITKRKTP